METKIKVLIADNADENTASLSSLLVEKGVEVHTCIKQGKVLLEEIKNVKPDVVLADVFMQEIDLIGVLQSLNKMELIKIAKVMLFNPLLNLLKNIPLNKVSSMIGDNMSMVKK